MSTASEVSLGDVLELSLFVARQRRFVATHHCPEQPEGKCWLGVMPLGDGKRVRFEAATIDEMLHGLLSQAEVALG